MPQVPSATTNATFDYLTLSRSNFWPTLQAHIGLTNHDSQLFFLIQIALQSPPNEPDSVQPLRTLNPYWTVQVYLAATTGQQVGLAKPASITDAENERHTPSLLFETEEYQSSARIGNLCRSRGTQGGGEGDGSCVKTVRHRESGSIVISSFTPWLFTPYKVRSIRSIQVTICG